MIRIALVLVVVCTAVAAGPVEDAADKVLAAVKAKQNLKLLASVERPDPWRVADELCARGEFDAALRFSKAAPSKSTAKLPAYVESLRGKQARVEARQAIAAAGSSLLKNNDGKAALAALKGVATDSLDVTSGRVYFYRAWAHRSLRRFKEGEQAYVRAADLQERLGWLSGACLALHWAGMCALEREDLGAAVSVWERRAALEERRADSAGMARSLANLAYVEMHLGKYDRALKNNTRALVLFEAEGNRRMVATLLNNIGTVRADSGEHREALATFERLLPLAKELGDQKSLQRALGGIATAYESLGRYRESLRFFEQRLEVSLALKDRPDVAVMLNNIGKVHLAMAGRSGAEADTKKALACFEKSRKLFGELADQAGVARALVNMGAAHGMLGDRDEEITCLRGGLALAEKLGNRELVSGALANLGAAYEGRREYGRALEHRKRALEFYAAAGNRQEEAGQLRAIGSLQAILGMYGDALRSEQRALRISEEFNDRALRAQVLGDLGRIHHHLGSYGEALACKEQVLRLSQELDDQVSVSATLGNLGVTYRALGNSAKALEFQMRALELRKQLGLQGGVANALINIGATHADRGEHEKALEYQQRALAIMEELKDRRGVSAALSNIGSNYTSLGEHARAREYHERALKVAVETEDRLAIAETLTILGSAHARGGAYDKALECERRALRLARELGATAIEVRALESLAALHFREKDYAETLRIADLALKKIPLLVGGLADEQGARARGRWTGPAYYGIVSALESKKTDAAFSFVESMRAGGLLESLGGRQRLRGALVPAGLREAEFGARAREKLALARYREVLANAGDVEQSWKSVERARREIVDAVARIQRARKLKADLVYPRAVSLADFQRVLRPHEAFVQFVYLQKKLVALVVASGESRPVNLGDHREIDAAVTKFQAAVMRPDERGMRAPEHERVPFLSARLRKLLLEPLRLPRETTRVLVSPHNQLAFLPIGLLCEREVVYLPSGTTYHLLTESEGGKRGGQVLALGDPEYHGRLAALPETGKEARAVGDVVLLGKRAALPVLAQTLESGSERWRSIHFACHGNVDAKQPALSELSLTGAPLRCMDVFGLRMSADLVVLSGCETAKGKAYKAEGVVGFVRAFMAAGAPRVIVSLWKVDDAATRALMEKFYELWKPGKVPTATALRNAQQHVASQPQWKHPYFWAAWQLWGLGE